MRNMPIRITVIGPRNETFDLKRGTPEHHSHSADALASSAMPPTIMKVEGSLHLQDAELLERTCREVSEQSGQTVVVELSDICFIDGASAAVLSSGVANTAWFLRLAISLKPTPKNAIPMTISGQ